MPPAPFPTSYLLPPTTQLERQLHHRLHHSPRYSRPLERSVRARRSRHTRQDLPEHTRRDIIHRQIEVRMVQYVEQIRADGQLIPLMHAERLVDIEVSVKVSRPPEGVARDIAEVVLIALARELRRRIAIDVRRAAVREPIAA